MNKSALDYMLSSMTLRYHRMLLTTDSIVYHECYLFIDFCVNFLTRNGFIVYYDEVEHKYVIAK